MRDYIVDLSKERLARMTPEQEREHWQRVFRDANEIVAEHEDDLPCRAGTEAELQRLFDRSMP